MLFTQKENKLVYPEVTSSNKQTGIFSASVSGRVLLVNQFIYIIVFWTNYFLLNPGIIRIKLMLDP